MDDVPFKTYTTVCRIRAYMDVFTACLFFYSCQWTVVRHRKIRSNTSKKQKLRETLAFLVYIELGSYKF